jgi:hypothetical protein
MIESMLMEKKQFASGVVEFLRFVKTRYSALGLASDIRVNSQMIWIRSFIGKGSSHTPFGRWLQKWKVLNLSQET